MEKEESVVVLHLATEPLKRTHSGLELVKVLPTVQTNASYTVDRLFITYPDWVIIDLLELRSLGVLIGVPTVIVNQVPLSGSEP